MLKRAIAIYKIVFTQISTNFLVKNHAKEFAREFGTVHF